jgi:GT2 family glycosyltransferase
VAGLVEPVMLYIDNGSPSNFPKPSGALVHLPSFGNVGFGTAMNRLMNCAFSEHGCDAFVAANPDGFFHHNALLQLVQMVERYPEAVLEAAQFPEEFPKCFDLKTLDTPWASGCCMLIPRAVYMRIGGFDENFFMYVEDVDLSWRARLAGFAVKYVPDSLYSHPVIGRDPSGRETERLLISSRYLAHKWRNRKFQDFCTNGLIQDFGFKAEALPALPPVAFDPGPKGKAISCFTKEFSFADVRW